jgi:hypothetical protein
VLFHEVLPCFFFEVSRAFSSVVRQMPGYNSHFTNYFFLFVIYVPFSVFCALFV